MRIKITLRPTSKECRIPINYQYPLSCVIYSVLSMGSSEYASWLHNKGYVGKEGKVRKLFVFSKLHSLTKMELQNNTLKIKEGNLCHFQISSPMLEDFIPHFVTGLFLKREIIIASKDTIGKFSVESVETIESPDWQELLRVSPKIYFRSLSPMTLSIPNSDQNKASYYIRPEEPEFATAIRKNLLEKFIAIKGIEPKNKQLEFEFDRSYIQQRGGYERISKLIWIKEGDQVRETKIKSFIAPFTLSGSEELIQCAYDSGIGEKNSLGFGMIEWSQEKK